MSVSEIQYDVAVLPNGVYRVEAVTSEPSVTPMIGEPLDLTMPEVLDALRTALKTLGHWNMSPGAWMGVVVPLGAWRLRCHAWRP